jgi:hypothetical protein
MNTMFERVADLPVDPEVMTMVSLKYGRSAAGYSIDWVRQLPDVVTAHLRGTILQTYIYRHQWDEDDLRSWIAYELDENRTAVEDHILQVLGAYHRVLGHV